MCPPPPPPRPDPMFLNGTRHCCTFGKGLPNYVLANHVSQLASTHFVRPDLIMCALKHCGPCFEQCSKSMRLTCSDITPSRRVTQEGVPARNGGALVDQIWGIIMMAQGKLDFVSLLGTEAPQVMPAHTCCKIAYPDAITVTIPMHREYSAWAFASHGEHLVVPSHLILSPR